MKTFTERRQRLRELLAGPVCLSPATVYDALCARVAESVGYEIGLRGMDVGTGCGPGAMKGPMKGATIGHAKQRIKAGRYLGITEPGIIAAEAPNPMVNELVILPDIEKRLEGRKEPPRMSRVDSQPSVDSPRGSGERLRRSPRPACLRPGRPRSKC